MEEKIAIEFIKTYYLTMEGERREDMLQFYTDKSIMSFEGEHSVGTKKIKEKIDSFGFKKVNLTSSIIHHVLMAICSLDRTQNRQSRYSPKSC